MFFSPAEESFSLRSSLSRPPRTTLFPFLTVVIFSFSWHLLLFMGWLGPLGMKAVDLLLLGCQRNNVNKSFKYFYSRGTHFEMTGVWRVKARNISNFIIPPLKLYSSAKSSFLQHEFVLTEFMATATFKLGCYLLGSQEMNLWMSSSYHHNFSFVTY